MCYSNAAATREYWQNKSWLKIVIANVTHFFSHATGITDVAGDL